MSEEARIRALIWASAAFTAIGLMIVIFAMASCTMSFTDVEAAPGAKVEVKETQDPTNKTDATAKIPAFSF